MDPLLLAALVAYAVVTLLVQGIALALAVQMVHVTPEATDRSELPRVAVVIAARNEEEEIGRCLDALRSASPPPAEIVVVDGGSDDGTLATARARPGVRILSEPPLPDGWVGKNWACHLGAGATSSPYLLFLDADVRVGPRTIATAVAWAEREGADVVSLAPRIEMGSFWERVVMPFYVQMVLTYFRTPRVNRPDSRAAMANGQFLLVRRRAYEAIGGHAGVAGVVLEDVALARRWRAGGHPIRFGWAPELLTTRMYRDRHEMFEGLLKNVHDTRFSLGRQLGFLGGLLAFFLAPLAVLPLGLAVGSLPGAAVGLGLAGALFAKHAAFARGVGARARDGLLFPLAAGFYVVLVATSIRRGLRGAPLEWKGRSYPRLPEVQGPTAPPTR